MELKEYERDGVTYKSGEALRDAFMSMTFRKISDKQWIETDQSAISRFWLFNKEIRDLKADPRVWVEIQGIERSYDYTYDADVAKSIRFNLCYIRKEDGDQIVTRYAYSFESGKNTRHATFIIGGNNGVRFSPSPAKADPWVNLRTGEVPFPAISLNETWGAIAEASKR